MSTPESNGKRQAPTNRFSGKLVAKFALLLGSLTLTLAVIETGLHITGAQPPTATVFSSFFEYSPNTSWRGKSNAACRFKTSNFDALTSHDADGFRRCGIDTPIASDATSSERIVWVLGDSMVWGWGVDDGRTCVDQLNEDARRAGHDTKYRNLGHPGFSSLQEYLLLKELLAAGFKPHQVLVAFCGNDLAENLDERGERPFVRITQGSPDIANYPVARSRLRDASWWMKKHCRAWNFASYYWASWKEQRRIRRGPKPTLATTSEQRIALRYTYQLLRDLCNERGIAFAAIDEFRPQETLRNTCDELGIPVLDISRRLARNENSPDAERPWHFQTDPHLTEFGNRMMAEAIEEELRRHFPIDELSTPPVLTARAPSGSDRKTKTDQE